MKFFKYILLLVFFVSCEGKTNYKKPKDLIAKDQMIDLLTDMHLAIGATSVNNINSEKSKKYMFLVFDKYKIDSTRFASSNLYYTSNVDEYREMYEEINKRLDDIRKRYEIEPDSIAKQAYDSLKFIRNNKSSKKKIPR
ncbi:MAG: DUF4296 domain-containing protein [Bacteroidota bacterium]